METRDLSLQQLHAYFLEHVRYEMQLLLNAAIAIDQKLHVPPGLECMIVESFSIHLRNLVTFLYPSTTRNTDVKAADFFTISDKWERLRPNQSNLLKDAKTRADVEVGHLTVFRKNGTPEEKVWDVRALTTELFPVFELFSNSADKVNLSSDIADLSNHYTYLLNLKTKWDDSNKS